MHDDQDPVHDEADREERAGAESALLEALLGHVARPSGETWDALRKASDAMLALGGDHFTYGISWSGEIDTRVGPLLAGDPATWGLLLQGLARRGRPVGDTLLARFTEASPFKGKLVIYAQSGSSHQPTYYGDTDPLIEQALSGRLPVTLSPYHAMFVVDRPATSAVAPVPDDDSDSVGC